MMTSFMQVVVLKFKRNGQKSAFFAFSQTVVNFIRSRSFDDYCSSFQGFRFSEG